MTLFQSKLREAGVATNPYVAGMHITVTPGNADAVIEGAIRTFVSSTKRPPPRLLLVILPFADSSIYNRVKFLCDVKTGIHSVGIIGSKCAKERNDQYFANVALEVSLKLGGRNQSLDASKLGLISEGKTMVVGVDVTHPSPGSASTAPSVAGIVASVDKWLAQWPADLQVQQRARQEMVSGLGGMVTSRLRLWAKVNKACPENILIYRDGVSDGQYRVVLKDELPLIRQACQELYPASETKRGFPRLSIIIVGKRHNTRFYPTKTEDADRSSNPQKGTILDRGVTEARNRDFFLQSHTALQGTA